MPLGFASMLIQAVAFAWVYRQAFAGSERSFRAKAAAYAAFGAVLSWSFTTLAVAAKNLMSSVPDYIVIEMANNGLTIVGEAAEYAHEVFEFFRECEREGIKKIYCEKIEATGIGSALMDRLRRAAQG